MSYSVIPFLMILAIPLLAGLALIVDAVILYICRMFSR